MDKKTSALFFTAIPMIGVWIYIIVMAFLGTEWYIFPIGFGFTAMLFGFYSALVSDSCPRGERKVPTPDGKTICIDKNVSYHWGSPKNK